MSIIPCNLYLIGFVVPDTHAHTNSPIVFLLTMGAAFIIIITLCELFVLYVHHICHTNKIQ